ncbi:hypothetical protein HYW21_03260 [Candidatus Woesearchaeota archaeon]|nr:hypothetical protein [Candidatus Woesearchaeota archaeon]
MQITINIEKKHVYLLIGTLVLLASIVLVVATGWTSGTSFHDILYANTIRAKDQGTVTVNDGLTVESAARVNDGLTADGLTINQNAAIAGTLTVGGRTTIGGVLDVATLQPASSLLTVSSDLKITGEYNDVRYIRMGNKNPGTYYYLRFLSDDISPNSGEGHFGGIMHNVNDPNFGDGNDFTIFSYGNRDIWLYPSGGKVVAKGNTEVEGTLTTGKTEVRGDLTVTGKIQSLHVFESLCNDGHKESGEWNDEAWCGSENELLTESTCVVFVRSFNQNDDDTDPIKGGWCEIEQNRLVGHMFTSGSDGDNTAANMICGALCGSALIQHGELS